MQSNRRSLLVSYFLATVISLPVFGAFVIFCLCHDSGGRPSSSITRNQWRHGWPLTYLWRQWFPYVSPEEERWNSSLLSPFWSPRWPWMHWRYGNRPFHFEPWALAVDVLVVLFIGFATIYCVRRLLVSRLPNMQFSLRSVLALPILVAFGTGCCRYSGRLADATLTVLLLTGLACAAVVTCRALRWTARRFESLIFKCCRQYFY